MADKQIDIGAELGKGWELYKANMGLLMVATLIGLVISGLTCGILYGPMSAGVFLIVRRVIQNDPVAPQAGDVFKGFDYFLQALLLVVILWVPAALVMTVLKVAVPFLGYLASMVISAFVSSVMMWGVLFVVHQKLTAIDAIKKIIDGLKSGTLTSALLFGAIACFLSNLGAFACVVGLIFTAPFAYCCLGNVYESLYGGDAGGGASEATVVEPEVIPPASDLRL